VYVPLYGLQKKKYSTAYPKWFNPLLLEDQLAGEERIEVGLGLVAGNGGRRGPSTSAGLRPSSPVAVGMSVGVVRRTLLLAGTQDQWNGHRGVLLQLKMLALQDLLALLLHVAEDAVLLEDVLVELLRGHFR